MEDLKYIGPCCKCGCPVGLPASLEKAARHSKYITFYCAYGHGLSFPEVKQEDKLKPDPPKIVVDNVVKLEKKNDVTSS